MILSLHELIPKYNMKITGIIHIGAHHGEEHATYTEIGVNKVVYFEPSNRSFNTLIKNVPIECAYNYAIGEEDKILEMNIEILDSYGCSSVLKPSGNYNSVEFTTEIVEMKRLDSLTLEGFNMLNIDVQGYELNVLKGAVKTLNNVDYIMCEINRHTPTKQIDYIGASTIDEVSEFLSAYDFRMVEQNWAGVSWGDGLFIKN